VNPQLAQWRTQPWAMEPARLASFLEEVSRLDGRNGAADRQAFLATRREAMTVREGIAVVAIRGVLLASVPAWVRQEGFEATGYDEIVADVAAALADDRTRRIRLEVDSPGGEVAGSLEAADAIFAARAVKPVEARVRNLAASAAYKLASQAQSIGADRNAIIGAIGVFGVWEDSSAAAAAAGVRVIVIRSGEHKGMGVPGSAISEAQTAAWQEVIDAVAENFIAAVARGRNLAVETVAKLASGRVWLAAAAQALGLVDEVDTTAAAAERTPRREQESEAKMSEKQQERDGRDGGAADATAARRDATADERKRLADLEAAFPGETAFVLAQFKGGATPDQARSAYGEVLAGKLAAREKELAAVQAELAALRSQAEEAKTRRAGPEARGAAPVPHGAPAAAARDFLETGREIAREEGISLTAAMRRLAREQPELHRAFATRANG